MEIFLSKRKGTVLIDETDAPRVRDYRWHLLRIGGLQYAVRREMVDGVNKKIYMHRMLLPDAPMVDHINGNGLDNRRCNLRAATHTENARNSRAHKNNKSGFKGVSWAKKSAKGRPWQAQIKYGGKVRHLGFYATPDEAARAYNDAAATHFGEFARAHALVPAALEDAA